MGALMIIALYDDVMGSNVVSCMKPNDRSTLTHEEPLFALAMGNPLAERAVLQN